MFCKYSKRKSQQHIEILFVCISILLIIGCSHKSKVIASFWETDILSCQLDMNDIDNDFLQMELNQLSQGEISSNELEEIKKSKIQFYIMQ